MNIRELLTLAVEKGASDLHLGSEEPPILRLEGELRRLEQPPLGRAEVREMIHETMNDAQQQRYSERHDLDYSFEIPGLARFRVSALFERKGEAISFRVIPSKVVTLDELAMPAVLKELCRRERGIVLCTGPTGSGKSTTLAAMVDYVNENEECHIITIEDPIEFVHRSKKALIRQREVGTNTESFATALRASLREDPDVILVGEMRDLETIHLALTAAETGHLVFATLHTSSAPKTIDRVIDVFPPSQQAQIRTMFSESIEGIITQTLCRKKGGGRVAACEILIGNQAVRNLIREAKGHQIASSMQTGQKTGMQTLDMALQDLVSRGLITKEEGASRSSNPRLFGTPMAPLGVRS